MNEALGLGNPLCAATTSQLKLKAKQKREKRGKCNLFPGFAGTLFPVFMQLKNEFKCFNLIKNKSSE